MMRKSFFCLLCVLLLFFISCHKQKESKKVDFESLMGKDLPCWQYVQTPEDYQALSLFKKVYEERISLLKTANVNEKVPKTLHFIWLGPKEFPFESLEYVKSWIGKHPDWKVKFWSDRKRPLPHTKMELCLLEDFSFQFLKDCFLKTQNWAEKADLLRYEILFQEGGLYVDHDIKCMKSFEDLNCAYDLYCGLELPSNHPLDSSIHITNNLIGCKAAHPVMKATIDWLQAKWEAIESLYPGSGKQETINRIAHRTFHAFSAAVETFGNKTTIDMVFPAYYFNAPSDAEAIFARHLYAGTWFENESAFEKMTRKRLMKISKKLNQVLLFGGVLFSSQIVLTSFFLLSKLKGKRKIQG